MATTGKPALPRRNGRSAGGGLCRAREKLVAQAKMGWNRIVSWLHGIELLRQSGLALPNHAHSAI